MIFINYEDILPELKARGFIEVTDEQNLIRLELGTDVQVGAYHYADPASKVLPYPGAEVINCTTDELPGIIERMLTKLHLSEMLVIPVERWSTIIDSIAFAMASDENWTEIDAIMAMHQNTRNALSVPRSEMPVLINMIRALLQNADRPQQDISIVSEVRPVIFEIFTDGAVSVIADATLAEQLAHSAVGRLNDVS